MASEDHSTSANVNDSTKNENFNSSELDSRPSSPSPGLGPRDAYDSLPRWRLAMRKFLLRDQEWQSTAIANMQARVRTPWLDRYFVYTSSLGTHTFFMTFLPMCFFFGFDQFGRGLLFVLAFGVYISSLFKDLACVPRPYSPPVTRLTIGNHHLEYGFPSTHSTNSISIALFFYTHIHRLASPSPSVPPSTMMTTFSPPEDWAISSTTYWISTVLLVIYAFSIVYGRLYTAMHTFTDCAAGAVLGALIWAAYWALEERLESWVVNSGWSVPLTVIILCAVMVNQHPVPIDDCPCFEDAIAFLSVLLGSFLGRWQAVHSGFDASFFVTSMPGTTFSTESTTWTSLGLWWGTATLKMVFGILVIFVWRIIAKSTLHLVLPPTFRLLAQIFTLPHRRFYTPATDYKSVPSELGLRPIPSVIDLPGAMGMEMEIDVGRRGGRTSGYGTPLGAGGEEVRVRGKVMNGRKSRGYGTIYGTGAGNEKRGWEVEKDGDEQVKDENPVKHYDADVVTKVIVYSGIAYFATTWLPVLYEVVGWGVKSW